MVIGKTNIIENFKNIEMDFDGEQIKFAKKIELLGVTITEDLELDTFVNETIKKCYGRLAVLRKLKISSFELRKNLSVTTVISCLDYGNSLLAGAAKKYVEKYQKVIRSVIRYIFGLKRFEPTTQHRQNLHLLDATQRSKYKVLLLTWKAIHLKQPKILLDILPPRQVHENLRSASDFNKIGIPQCPPTRKTKTCFYILVKNVTNYLNVFRTLKTKKLSKKALKMHIFLL